MNAVVFDGIYILMLLLAVFGMRCEEKKQNIILAIQTVMIGTLYGLRGVGVGHDTIAYYTMYMEKDCFQTRYTVEPAFQLLVTLLRKLAPNVQLFLWGLSMITAIALAVMCKNFMSGNLKYLNIAFTLLFCMPYTILMHINVVRQGIAFALLFCGISFVYRKKYIMGFCIAILGCTFHYSAFVILVAFLFFWLIKNWKIECGLTLTFGVIGLAIANTGVLVYVLQFIPRNQLTDRLLNYIGEETGGNTLIKLGYYSVFFLFLTIIYICGQKKKSTILYELFAGVLSASALLNFNALAAGRLVIVIDYFVVFALLGNDTVNLIGNQIGEKGKRIYEVLVILACALLLCVSLFTYSLRYNLNFII